MRRNQTRLNAAIKTASIVAFFAMVLIFGRYWYNVQQEKANNLQRQIESLQRRIEALPDQSYGKDKVSLEKDRIALEKDPVAIENTVAATLIQGFGGLFFVVTAFFSWQDMKAIQRNILISEEKQVTERFTQAINQLGTEGDDKIAVRLGGIYALGRIAEDSPRDYWTIMEILTSFIREKVWLLKAEQPGSQKLLIAQDVQAALTVIGRPGIQKSGE